jgi:hypothetical protein
MMVEGPNADSTLADVESFDYAEFSAVYPAKAGVNQVSQLAMARDFMRHMGRRAACVERREVRGRLLRHTVARRPLY